MLVSNGRGRAARGSSQPGDAPERPVARNTTETPDWVPAVGSGLVTESAVPLPAFSNIGFLEHISLPQSNIPISSVWITFSVHRYWEKEFSCCLGLPSTSIQLAQRCSMLYEYFILKYEV